MNGNAMRIVKSGRSAEALHHAVDRGRGEPLFSFSTPPLLAQEVQALGFAEVRNFGGRKLIGDTMTSAPTVCARLIYVHLMGAGPDSRGTALTGLHGANASG
jgi:hypothetical protein